MTYPTSQPKMKHDLSSASQEVPGYPSSLISEMGISNSAELFRRLEEPLDPAARPHQIGSVYSYSDAPDYPGPLSRSLIFLGVADTSLSLVRKVISQEGIPDCLHKCTIAVQLADAKHISKLEPRHQANSKIFSKFMKQLRKDEAVAIVSKDKHGRFAILAPMGEAGPSDDDPSTITAEDCAAFCYVGDAKEVMKFLATSAAQGVGMNTQSDSNEATMWQPPAAESDPATGLWQPPGASEDAVETPAFSAPWESSANNESTSTPAWDAAPVGGDDTMAWGTNGGKRSFEEMNGGNDDEDVGVNNANGENTFHSDTGAAAADAFYSGLTRSLNTRADSYLFHMRAFNGWVKATQIQELDPIAIIRGKPQGKTPLRILDLACGKGGDLNKWSLHSRGIKSYVGIDVARGSLKDAAIRAREMRKKNKLSQAIFTVADLGADVPGRKKSPNHKHMQKLLTWSLQDETEYESAPPEFEMKRGGGISENDRFDVVSIQFAIHYMMSTRERARRFFHTVSELLEVGGNLVCTTIDARVVIDHLMNLGHNYHFNSDEEPEFSEAVVEAGAGACKIRFKPEIVKTIVTSGSDGSKAEDDLFGLQYAFTLVEGSDHAAGVGDAVNLPEWLTPLPVLEALAQEAGLELDYAQNFHEFYEKRRDPSTNPAAHLALYNMKVLNRDGSISSDEWSVSRLYAAIKFRKVRESTMKVEEENEEDDNAESDEEPPKEEPEVELDPIKAKKMLPMAMIKAKRSAGEEVWNSLSSEEKKRLTQVELQVLAKK
jgi:mRNA (guanine-N7-)-methyltransferase